MKKLPVQLLVLLFVLSLVSAAETTVKILVDTAEHGAVARVLDADTERRIDSGVPMKNYKTGLVEGKFESNRDEVKLLLLITKDGEIIDSRTVGPYETGGEIELDCRTGKDCKELEKIKEEEPKPEKKDEKNSTKTKNNSTNKTAPGNNSNSQNKTENKSLKRSFTGNSIGASILSNSKKIYYSAAIVAAMSLVLLFILVSRKNKARGENLVVLEESKPKKGLFFKREKKTPEEKELERLQRELMEKEERIKSIKRRKEVQKRIQEIKEKLERDEKVLRELEEKE